MSSQLALTFTTPPLMPQRRPTPRAATWKAYAEHITRYRICVRHDLGRGYTCEVPWQPGDLAFTERMGPERRPCVLCELRRELLEVIERGLHAESDAEQERIESGTYLAWLEQDVSLMAKVERFLAGQPRDLEREGALVTALVMAREFGTAEAALEALQDDAYAMDAPYFGIVRMYLRVLHLPKQNAVERLHAWTREQEAA